MVIEIYLGKRRGCRGLGTPERPRRRRSKWRVRFRFVGGEKGKKMCVGRKREMER